MSDILDTDVAPFCHGQNHSGSVTVPTGRETATLAPKASLVQFESLDSRETPTARHSRVRGPDHHHPPPGPPGTLGQFTLDRTDRGISGLTRHPGLRQEPRFEILDGDRIMALDNTLGPHPRIMHGFSGGFLRQPSNTPLRSGQQLSELGERRLLPGFVLVDCFVPQPAAAAPLGQQRFLGGAAGPNPVRVPHHLIHSNILSKGNAMNHRRRVHLFLSAVNDSVTKADPR